MYHRVTVVDEDPSLAAGLREALAEHAGTFEVDTAPTVAAVLDRLDEGERLDCLVTDHEPPERDAVELAREATARDPDLAVLLSLTSAPTGVAAEALAAGATDYSRREATDAPALAEQVAAAADRAGAARSRRERAAALSALAGITTDPEDSLVDAVERVLEIGRERLGMEYGGLARVEEGEYRVLAAATRGEGPMQPGDVLGLSEVYCELVVEGDRQVCFGRVADAPPGADTEGRTVNTEYGLRSYVGCPVRVDGRIWGTLCFADRRERRPFAAWELELVETLGGWLRDRLTDRAQRLRLRQERDRLTGFTAMVEHDIREPLSTARGAVTLAREAAGADDEPVADASPVAADLDRAMDALSRTDRLVEDLLRLSHESEQPADTVTVDVRGVAERAWDDVVTAEGAQDARLRVPRSVHVPADEALLRRLLVALFRFCLDSAADGPLTVTVSALDGRPGFYVADDGDGLPGESPTRPLDNGSDGVEGVGVGDLGSARAEADGGLDGIERIAAAHDWEVTAGLSVDGGARIEIGTQEGLWPETPGLD
jgi:GAF domain-containing protein